ncbi:hypothetical protein KKF81_06680 [Candidatus Micrarchaeota archaeon]|nr:hypothetical protein [Candidatus Micrarchaeota archaeon]MBU1166614.1 hypothetical protein [Candidatus Micrarchaeota archaeon]MBU1886659.1 hypothetical protein [Candidatus Micrarchaeota archaeon]
MKAQVSTELLIIIGFVLLLFIPLLGLVYFKSSEANQQIGAYQAELAVFRLASLANSVGSLGTDTIVYTNVYIPKETIELRTVQSGMASEIVLEIQTPTGPTEIVEIVKYPMNSYGTLVDSESAGGWMKVQISSEYDDEQGAVITIDRV